MYKTHFVHFFKQKINNKYYLPQMGYGVHLEGILRSLAK